MNHMAAYYLARSIADDHLRQAAKRRRPSISDELKPIDRPRPAGRSWATLARPRVAQPAKG